MKLVLVLPGLACQIRLELMGLLATCLLERAVNFDCAKLIRFIHSYISDFHLHDLQISLQLLLTHFFKRSFFLLEKKIV